MEYNFRAIEENWQKTWKENKVYQVKKDTGKPKCYVLDMFPYPSGSGLHVGHPLGYIASDIYSRYKRLKGFNVLHPMGYDSFGLPAEQYALETGQHPAVTTENNINNFRAQLEKIGFCYDWSREIRTSDPSYYKWTQSIFLDLFNSWYDRRISKARPIGELEATFEQEGTFGIASFFTEKKSFDAIEWAAFSKKEQEDILMDYRLSFSSYGEVNWCEALGTVLANDEVVNGFSERGGFPVVKKKMRQWYLRITEYADRLLQGLDKIEFTDSLKEQQKNWIGKSTGAEISFEVTSSALTTGDKKVLTVYTTRPDTIFGVDFMVIAPEHELVKQITTERQRTSIDDYLNYTKSRSDRERMAEVKQITGCFTGAFAINPFDGREIPVWIAEYVLIGYGTGAIMGVPCGDTRDFNFARFFDLPVTNIIGKHFNGTEANTTKEAILENSGFLTGTSMKEATELVVSKLEATGMGKRKVNFRMRDAGFSRQRYWGEPFPITWKDGSARALDKNELPLELPFVEEYGPGPEGEGPLANITEWTNLPDGSKRETSTMPGYAGSSWYFLRYMDPHNNAEFCSREASDYWNQVDLYIGGTEHAVGHLLYSRMWTKFLFDTGRISFDEPYKKLVNQGMITGKSFFVETYHAASADGRTAVLLSSAEKMLPVGPLDINGTVWTIDAESRQSSRLRYAHKYIDAVGRLAKSQIEKLFVEQPDQTIDLNSIIIYFNSKDLTETGEPFLSGTVVEKMSKSKYNVENPDDIVINYGADTFRMYEMFLGPIEMSKPWDTKGIEGVHRFLKKLWRLFFDEITGKVWNEQKAIAAELKVLHRCIRKIDDDTEKFSFNTAVSAFMVCINELTDLKCHKKEVLEKILILLAPYTPHITEELWHQLGNPGTILDAPFPEFEESHVIESSKEYPVSVNGKVRTTIHISLDASQQDVEVIVQNNDTIKKWLGEAAPKKIIYVKNKMINIVV
ncbi:MAG: class I tRNA ligase family protein [Chitinophagaceae bacterium]